ncbi:hypothetical protein CVV38_01445 [Candidatus Peregrinibacteria bacterium HGW-Peregrinibacteria-1]|jgi:hypothetical protein|nr:MAG: hypothetical protein CVV38_01445 [Candidatus Peregrinibacteria bacterium HGW-Peregrinibacteria-1]
MLNRPKENSQPWPPEAKTLFGEKFTDSVDQGVKIYEDHDINEIQADSALAIQLYRQAKPHMDMAIEEGTQNIINHYFERSDQKLDLKRDPTTILMGIEFLIASRYPQWLGRSCSEVIFLNTVISALKSAMLARLAKWRHINNRPHRPESDFYKLMGTEGDQAIKKSQERVQAMLLAGAYIEHIRLDEFFQKQAIGPQEDEAAITLADRRNLNSQIFDVISAHKRHGIPLSISEKSGLTQKPLHIQFEDLDPNSPEYSMFLARVILYHEQDGKMMKQNPNLLQFTKFQADLEKFTSVTSVFGNSIHLHISRHDGHLYGLKQFPADIKYLIGEKKYELLRTHLLLQLAGLTRPQAIQAISTGITDAVEEALGK